MPDAGARTWAAVAHDRPMRAAGMNAPTPPTSSMASGELERLEDLVAMGTKTIFRHLGEASADTPFVFSASNHGKEAVGSWVYRRRYAR